MIQKYVYGHPFPTDAVVKEIETAKEPLPFFETDNQGSFTYTLAEDDIVYGLGEQIRGINTIYSRTIMIRSSSVKE